MNEQSLTRHAIRMRMGRILKAVTGEPQFVASSVVTGFREWVWLSGLTRDERVIVEKISTDMLTEAERRIRLVKQTLHSEVFRKGD